MAVAIGKRIIVATILISVVLLTWTSSLDSPAMDDVDAGMKRALVTFAVARALNGAISLAQGTEFSAGFGANITFSVGEILDPVNDMVESFSDLMLLASVAFGIQKVLLTIGQDVLVKCLLTAALLGKVACYLMARNRARWLDVTLILLLMVRFAIPVVTLASDAIYTRFLEPGYEQGTVALEGSTQEMNKTSSDFREKAAAETASRPTAAPNPAPTPEPPASPHEQHADPGVWDTVADAAGSVRDKFNEITSKVKKLDPRSYLEQLKEQAGMATEHIIQLMVVFLLQTLLVPLFLLWAMYTALRGVLARALTS